MERHIHLHCIVPGGALTFDGEQFKPCPHRDWLFPVKALSKVFRGNYLERLERAHTTGELKTPPGTHFAALRKALREHDWVVYAKPPFGDRNRSSTTSGDTPTALPSATTAS
jgi:hypothetical protein